MPTKMNSMTSTAMKMNGARHCRWLASHSDSGTPATVERENAVDTMPLARARRANGMMSPTMVCTSAPITPPNTPASPRATSSVTKPGARAQASVARPNRANIDEQQAFAFETVDEGGAEQAGDGGAETV